MLLALNPPKWSHAAGGRHLLSHWSACVNSVSSAVKGTTSLAVAHADASACLRIRVGGRGNHMGLVLVILLLALVFGGLGLLVEGLKWALIVGLVLLAVGAVSGYTYRGGRRHTP
jgi:hypothetical protein